MQDMRWKRVRRSQFEANLRVHESMMHPVHIGTYTPRRSWISRINPENWIVIAVLVPVGLASLWFWSTDKPLADMLSTISVTLSFAF